MKNRPFAPVGPVESFVGIGPLGDALRQLQRSLAQGQSISLLIGENGSGKSHLCKYLATVETARHRPVYLSTAGFHTRRALLQAMLYELGADYVGLTEQEARLKLLESARKLQAGGRKLLLILDESHLLSSKMYEELRTLIDHTPTGQQQIQLVLAGSMELEEQLFAPELQAFNQRIGAQIVLESLTLQQSAEYLEARLHWAGAQTSSQAFSEEALEMICRACDGNIRCLNQLADHSLLLAYVEEVSPATPEHVKAALKDLKALPLQFSSTGIAEVESSGPDLSSTAELEALEELDSEPVSSPAPASPTVPVDELELLELFGQPESLATAKVAEVDET
ncbi:MAG: AAA family ATPase, partial [Planctomycetaceae bacterium]|nr:AAA family ATPase [Planctomycetaceae bacterium]